jgi:hypothetical protein
VPPWAAYTPAMKYRLEYRTERPGWVFYGDYPTKQDATGAGTTLRRQFGRATTSRVTPVPDDAPEPGQTQKPAPSNTAT